MTFAHTQLVLCIANTLTRIRRDVTLFRCGPTDRQLRLRTDTLSITAVSAQLEEDTRTQLLTAVTAAATEITQAVL